MYEWWKIKLLRHLFVRTTGKLKAKRAFNRVVKEAGPGEHNLVNDTKWDIPKLDNVLLVKLEQLTTKILRQNCTCRHKLIELWAKSFKRWRNFRNLSPPSPTSLHPQKSSQHVRACDKHDGAICSKNSKIVAYHKDSRNTRNSVIQ